jgi:triosephosphate isomerase
MDSMTKIKRRRKIVIGNWKLNPLTVKEAKTIWKGIKKSAVKVVVCPPYVYLDSLKSRDVALGAQNVFWESKGAFTGEISADMLKNLAVEYVITGHSERRALGETDSDVSKKIIATVKADMTAVLCIGESERDERGEYLSFLRNEIVNSLKGVSRKYTEPIVVAYEPIWAIGKGKEAMTAHDLHQMVIFIRKHLIEIYGVAAAEKIAIVYGGSVDTTNAADLVKQGEVDGLLVGRESLNPKNFSEIIRQLQ